MVSSDPTRLELLGRFGTPKLAGCHGVWGLHLLFPTSRRGQEVSSPGGPEQIGSKRFFFFFVGSKLSMHSVVLFVCLGVVIVEHRTTHPGVSSVSSHGWAVQFLSGLVVPYIFSVHPTNPCLMPMKSPCLMILGGNAPWKISAFFLLVTSCGSRKAHQPLPKDSRYPGLEPDFGGRWSGVDVDIMGGTFASIELNYIKLV